MAKKKKKPSFSIDGGSELLAEPIVAKRSRPRKDAVIQTHVVDVGMETMNETRAGDKGIGMIASSNLNMRVNEDDGTPISCANGETSKFELSDVLKTNANPDLGSSKVKWGDCGS
ncbi:hypothetical protein Drorol1_Dr00021246 [Drosera rotundifolia]